LRAINPKEDAAAFLTDLVQRPDSQPLFAPRPY
jgi:hypothetical protein